MKKTRTYYCWRDSMRLRRGLHWKDATPSMADMPNLKTALLYVLAALIAVALAVKTSEASEARREFAEAEAMLLDLLNGRHSLYTENGSGYGYGRTYITCRIEEMEV